MSYKAALDADARLAAKNALKILAALRQTFDAKAVYEQYLSTQPNKSNNPAQDRARARAWAIMNVQPNMQAMNTVMQRVLAEGYVTGEAFADEQLRLARELKKADDTYVDWANWKPGDRAAALLLRPPKAFQQLLQSQGIALKEMSETTTRDIGNAIADAVDLGMSAERSAKNIMRHVANPARALSIAITEQNRAISYATVSRYKEAGLEQMEWEVSSPCDKCAKNANQVVPIGSQFNSGNTQPPAHPHCRCVLLPVIPDFDNEPVTGATLTPMPTGVAHVGEAPSAARNEAQRIIDDIHARSSQTFVPGQWKQLDRETIRTREMDKFMGKFGKYGDSTAKRILDKDKATKSLIEKGIVFQNGQIEVQFYLGGASLPPSRMKEILDMIDDLQRTNPNGERLVFIVGPSKKGAYGWARLNGEEIWIAPKTAKMGTPNAAEAGTWKMPVLGEVPQFKYTITHEWGHHIDKGGSSFGGQAASTSSAISRLKARFPDAFKSEYGQTKMEEFFAENFAEFYLTGGRTTNEITQAMALEFGWVAP
jgi:SPP1 gp7 family putative phage head morphogenesis protein